MERRLAILMGWLMLMAIGRDFLMAILMGFAKAMMKERLMGLSSDFWKDWLMETLMGILTVKLMQMGFEMEKLTDWLTVKLTR
ncbi:MAG: hypothetical protein AAB837_02945 [Patescibacteria group bacterium]